MNSTRARWAAIGAAVAVSVGAGGFGIASAVVDDGVKPVFIPITPCRIMDTRNYNGFNVGPRATPIGANETYSVQATGGTNGQCSAIPAEAVGVVMNVTITDPTADTFVTIFASDAVRATASNLNALAGKREPVPNLVTTELSADGKFSVYNLQGTTNVIADVAGYYEDHNHDDRYLTDEEVAELIAAERALIDADLTERDAGRTQTLFANTDDDGTVLLGSEGITVERTALGTYTLTVDEGVLGEGVTLNDCQILAVPTDETVINLVVVEPGTDDLSVVLNTSLGILSADGGLQVNLSCLGAATTT